MALMFLSSSTDGRFTMTKLNKAFTLALLITLTVACQKKEENDTVTVHGTNRTIAEMISNGVTGCLTSGLAAIGTNVTGTSPSYSWEQSYQLTAAASDNFQLQTVIYDDATCTHSVYDVTQLGTLEVIGASTKVANGTDIKVTLTMTVFAVNNDASWVTLIAAACGGTDLAAGQFTSYGGVTCNASNLWKAFTLPADGTVLKNTFIYDDGNNTMKWNRDTTTHLGFYSLGKTTLPTSATFTFNAY
jgi:hypothetical protein